MVSYFKLFLDDFAESENLGEVIWPEISVKVDINEDMINAKVVDIRKLWRMVRERHVVEPIGNDLSGISE